MTATMPPSTPQPQSDPLKDFLCFSVYSTGLAFNRIYRPMLEKLGLTYPQYLVMVLLAGRDGLAVKEIGRTLFLESNTLTPLVKRLESAGYVRRERDHDDERIVRIFLTDQGRGIARQLACLPEEILARTGLSPEKLKDAVQSLVDIRKALLDAI